MKGKSYHIRNYTREDNRRLLELRTCIYKESRLLSHHALEEVFRDLDRPHHCPERDLFVAEQGSAIAGLMDVIPELGIKRALLNYVVCPEYQDSNILNELLRASTERAKELSLEYIHINVPEEEVSARELLREKGFRFVRRFLEMHVDIRERHFDIENPPGTRVRALKRGEEDKLAEIQNRSFKGTWGFNPNCLDEILHRIGLPDTSPEDVILGLHNQRAIAYCWTVGCEGSEGRLGNKARIHMLGVDPGFRGKGMGKAILQAGLSHLKSRGFYEVVLTCDSENKAACSLYRGAGFEVCSISLWYEKRVRQSLMLP